MSASQDLNMSWPFVASSGLSQDVDPPDPLWQELQESGGLGLAAATLPRDRLPCRVEATASCVGDEHTPVLRTLVEEALAALLRDGAVVLSGAATSSACASVVRDVSDEAAKASINQTSCGCGVAAVSTASHTLLADHRVMALCNGILGAQVIQLSQTELEHLFTDARNPPQRDRRSLQMPWELHVSHAAAGNAAIAPHSDWHHGGHRGPQKIAVLDRLAGSMQLDAYWCLEPSRTASVLIEVRLAGMATSVELDTGDVLLVRDNIWRRALSCTDGFTLRAGYQLSFLDAEENLLCQCPPHVARDFPSHMQRLVGYTQPYRNLSRFSAGVVNQQTMANTLNMDQNSADPAQALGFVREADWATPSAPDQPESTWAEAQSLMLSWGEITESVLEGWCEELLPPAQNRGVVSVACCGTPDMMRTMLAALYRDGAVVLTDAIALTTCNFIIQQLQPYHGKSASRAIGGVVARSPAARNCALHPALLALAEGVLGHQCLRPHGQRSGAHLVRDHLPLPTNRATWGQTAYSSTGGLAWKYAVDHTINSAPLNSDSSRGNMQAQLLHRDGHKWMLDLVPEIENELKTIWALSRFTAQTGATKVIRGSHRWPSVIALSPPPPETAETVSMEPGSCLIYTSGVLHAGGNNQSPSHRMALTLGYNLSFLKSADAVCLFSPPPDAPNRLPKQLQDLLGYAPTNKQCSRL